MSSTQLYVFVEGQSDRHFYDELCNAILAPHKVKFDVVLSQELPGGNPGKIWVLKFYDYLRRSDFLVDNFRGKTTVSVFFVDKDLDDLRGRQVSSPHVVYSEHYHFENYYFANGDMVKSLAASSSLTCETVRKRLGRSAVRWRKRAAENWSDWLKLCVYCMVKGIGSDCTYKSTSKLNEPYQSASPTQLASKLAQVQSRSGLASDAFTRSFAYYARLVDKLIDKDRFDLIFKGRWYSVFLVQDAKLAAGGRAYQSKSLGERVLASLAMTIDFDDSWTDRYRDALNALVKEL